MCACMCVCVCVCVFYAYEFVDVSTCIAESVIHKAVCGQPLGTSTIFSQTFFVSTIFSQTQKTKRTQTHFAFFVVLIDVSFPEFSSVLLEKLVLRLSVSCVVVLGLKRKKEREEMRKEQREECTQ